MKYPACNNEQFRCQFTRMNVWLLSVPLRQIRGQKNGFLDFPRSGNRMMYGLWRFFGSGTKKSYYFKMICETSSESLVDIIYIRDDRDCNSNVDGTAIYCKKKKDFMQTLKISLTEIALRFFFTEYASIKPKITEASGIWYSQHLWWIC